LGPLIQKNEAVHSVLIWQDRPEKVPAIYRENMHNNNNLEIRIQSNNLRIKIK